jgi:hypothetical protein
MRRPPLLTNSSLLSINKPSIFDMSACFRFYSALPAKVLDDSRCRVPRLSRLILALRRCISRTIGTFDSLTFGRVHEVSLGVPEVASCSVNLIVPT